MVDFLFCKQTLLDSEDAALGFRSLIAQCGGAPQVFHEESALRQALQKERMADSPRDPLILIVDSAWVTLERHCIERLLEGLAKGADIAVACDSSHPSPMRQPDYATIRGMERFVSAHGNLGALEETSAAPDHPAALLCRASGFERYRQGEARHIKVAGAWAHNGAGYFAGERADVLPLIPPALKRIADIGGGEGGFLCAVKARYPNAFTQLVELTNEASEVARHRPCIDAVWTGSFFDWQPEGHFDCISFLDVIEHIAEPEQALLHAKGLLSPGGCLLLSIPNVGHWSVLADLIEGRWDWASVGIHCYTHVRFFTLKTIEDMLMRCGLRIDDMLRVELPCPPQLSGPLEGLGLNVDMASLNTHAYLLRVCDATAKVS